VKRGWYPKQNMARTRSPAKRIGWTEEGRRTGLSTLPISAIPSNNVRVKRITSLRVCSVEVTRGIHSSTISACKFAEFVSVDGWPNRVVSLPRSLSRFSRMRRRIFQRLGVQSTISGYRLPGTAHWLQSQACRNFRESDIDPGPILIHECKRPCAAAFHAFDASPMNYVQFMVPGTQRE
jgi:hypothetical protein